MIIRKFWIITGLAIFVLHSVQASETDKAALMWIPGNANPWLAGMPNGSIAGSHFDVAPDQSPIQVKGMPVSAGAIFTFSVVGGVAHDPNFILQGADGNDSMIMSRSPGAENGIGDITAPCEALVGVFLDDNLPADFAPPAALNFSRASDRDFLTLAPALRQPFFIGDGKDSSGDAQQFIAPAGATRLFLGTMDSYQWSNNQGSFTVRAAALP